jgi:hypothetical protein
MLWLQSNQQIVLVLSIGTILPSLKVEIKPFGVFVWNRLRGILDFYTQASGRIGLCSYVFPRSIFLYQKIYITHCILRIKICILAELKKSIPDPAGSI